METATPERFNSLQLVDFTTNEQLFFPKPEYFDWSDPKTTPFLGHLAATGYLLGETTTNLVMREVNRYRRLTGCDPRSCSQTIFRITQRDTKAGEPYRRGTKYEIKFSDFNDFPVRLLENRNDLQTKNKISSVWCFWALVELGYRLGAVQDIKAIRESIPHKLRAVFDAAVKKSLLAKKK